MAVKEKSEFFISWLQTKLKDSVHMTVIYCAWSSVWSKKNVLEKKQRIGKISKSVKKSIAKKTSIIDN